MVQGLAQGKVQDPISEKQTKSKKKNKRPGVWLKWQNVYLASMRL
jgi:hypothetical protein